ncbi:NAD(P)H-dependent flavin oxidoreductase [Sediminivirga luteola]|uniref:NAD(P)H-dependent flavin oxidoreductase n=1 Tax=Sediminivirga luteola TaxID=1774748 RepID=UPI00166668D4|nr:nitronate monooxygenase [Sediminivirga luteola]
MTGSRLLDSRLPIVAAPMAGGPTTTALAAAVSRAGGFPFLAGGYKSVDALRSEIEEMRGLDAPFGVNLFVPEGRSPDLSAFTGYAGRLQPEADEFGLQLDPAPVWDDDSWDAKLELLLSLQVPVVSLTFGLPDQSDIAALQLSGARVLATVTTPEEARAAQQAGADGLVVQGPGAGGHSAIHDPGCLPAEVPTAELVGQISVATGLPVVGAGGVDGPVSFRAVLDAGAEAVAVGTLLLRTDEAGTSPTHRAALAEGTRETVLTRAFTGRPARALRNGFIDRHQDAAPVGYPAVHHLTRALRQAAGAAGDAERLHLWAGTGYRQARTGPAGEVIRWLAQDL